MVCANGDVMLGFGFTIMVYLYEAPKQAVTPATVAVALYSIVMSAFVVLVKVCAGIVLVPEEAKVSFIPAGCVVVQPKATPVVVLFKVTNAVELPEQIVCGLCEKVTAGDGFTVIVKVVIVPGHPFIDGVTVMVAIIGFVPLLMAVNWGISPIPLAPIPIAGLLLIQL
jgi:hypothetical protein